MEVTLRIRQYLKNENNLILLYAYEEVTKAHNVSQLFVHATQ